MIYRRFNRESPAAQQFGHFLDIGGKQCANPASAGRLQFLKAPRYRPGRPVLPGRRLRFWLAELIGAAAEAFAADGAASDGVPSSTGSP